jgi:hypothetical protein
MGIIGVIVGLLIGWGGGSELLGWWRARHRVLKTVGVVVGRVEVLGQGAGVHNRAGCFRFTTAEGIVVEAVSARYSFPGPRPGKRVAIVYDPADPHGTAELAGTRAFKLALSPALIAGGMVLAGFSLARL